MKNTADKILETALLLYNQHGMHLVTLRQIAQHMDISQGNLNYHFAKKEQLIQTLYDRFALAMEQLVQERLSNEELDLEQFNAFLQGIMTLFLEYRFIFLDFPRLMQEYPEIKSHYVQLVQQRYTQFSRLMKTLSEKGILKAEAFPGQFMHLYQRIQLLTDFWISYHVIEGRLDAAEIKLSYVRAIQETLFPYLSEAVQQDWAASLSGKA